MVRTLKDNMRRLQQDQSKDTDVTFAVPAPKSEDRKPLRDLSASPKKNYQIGPASG